jgi:hypothetical protein
MAGGRPGIKPVPGARPLLAIITGVVFTGGALAQGAGPFAFLFGGSPREGRSLYAPAPAYGSGHSTAMAHPGTATRLYRDMLTLWL